MDACGCEQGYEIFDRRNADADLVRYRRSGPDQTTRMLLGFVRAAGVEGRTLLDIGGGIGVVDHELLDAGLSHALLVDASPPSVHVARAEARRRGELDRLEIMDGDFVARAAAIQPTDIVTLDRVICCYPSVERLVRLSADRAKSVYGLVLPRDRWLVRFAIWLENHWMRLRRRRYRAYAHPNATVDALVAAAGLRPRAEGRTFYWRVVVYERVAPGAPASA
jgi:magnesium-protoporphyrin O-methyltransferase